MSLEVVSTTGAPPVTLEQAKAHLGITADSDARLQPLLDAAISTVEATLRRTLRTQSLLLRLRAWPSDPIRLPRPRLVSVTEIQYVATDGTLTTLAADQYAVDVNATPGTIQPAAGVSRPALRDQFDAIKIEYVAGPVAIEPDIVAAILLTLEELYDGSVNDLRQKTIYCLLAKRIEPLRVHED